MLAEENSFGIQNLKWQKLFKRLTRTLLQVLLKGAFMDRLSGFSCSDFVFQLLDNSSASPRYEPLYKQLANCAVLAPSV